MVKIWIRKKTKARNAGYVAGRRTKGGPSPTQGTEGTRRIKSLVVG
jgi:hypothetical protein